MRALVIPLALLAGCFKPSPQEGFACFGQERWCPDPLTCQPDGTCRSSPGGGDGGGDDGPGPDGITGGPANIAFVTSGVFTAKSLGGIAGADEMCHQIGKSIGHDGRYVAWLSTAAQPAGMRLGNASGWVRVDGLPFAATKADLLAGKILYPLRRDESNTDLAGVVMTGTTPDGNGNENCVDLTSSSPTELILLGHSDGDINRWTNDDEGSCDQQFHIYCLQADTNTVVPIAPPTGLRTFLSSPFSPGGGVAAADTVCRNDAIANGLGNKFTAGLALTTASVRARVGTPSMPWARVDGVATTIDFVMTDGAISVTADGLHVDEQVFSGAVHPDLAAASGSENCNNWGAGGSTALNGLSARATRDDMFGRSSGSCGSKRVYCFEF